MARNPALLTTLFLLAARCCFAQAPSAASPALPIWTPLSGPAMDPSKPAHTENVVIVRDCVRITLTDGTIQFLQPANGVVFGAVFHGTGKVQADPPNPIEAQQLRLPAKQDKLALPFTHPTFTSPSPLLPAFPTH